jgi:two-component system, LytTR family, sensor kinase
MSYPDAPLQFFMMYALNRMTNAVCHSFLTKSIGKLYLCSMKVNILKCLNIWYIREPLLFMVMFVVFFNGSDVYITPTEKVNIFKESFIDFSMLYGFAQLVNYFVLPIWLDKGDFWKFIGIITLALFGFSVIHYKVEQFLFYDIFSKIPNFEMTYLMSIQTCVISLLVISSIAFIKRMYENEKRQSEAKLLINQLEINQLKGQINPHFLFNTLNNLYGVSLEEPHRAPELILQLSQLMRYQVEAGQKEMVSLCEELEFIDNFIALETERVGQRCMVKIKRNLNCVDFKIPPMLLISLVENAFKHGTATADKCWIHLFLGCEENGEFNLMLRNSLPLKPKKVTSTGIGVMNTQMRLERLFPNKYTFNKVQTDTYYDVQLNLKLSK